MIWQFSIICHAEYLYTIFVDEFGFCFAQNFINCCNHLPYFANITWTRLFSCNILMSIFTETPTFDLNGAFILGLLLKIIFENINGEHCIVYMPFFFFFFLLHDICKIFSILIKVVHIPQRYILPQILLKGHCMHSAFYFHILFLISQYTKTKMFDNIPPKTSFMT